METNYNPHEQALALHSDRIDEETRLVQARLLEILKAIDKVCRTHHLTYYLLAGTMLGAVRHGGFIPWDDDTDLAMPRSDFEKAYQLLHDDLEKYGISLEYYVNEIHCLTLSYRHNETGIWVDIMPMDTFVSPYNLDKTQSFITPKILKYIKYYDSHIKSSVETLWKKKEDSLW